PVDLGTDMTIRTGLDEIGELLGDISEISQKLFALNIKSLDISKGGRTKHSLGDTLLLLPVFVTGLGERFKAYPWESIDHRLQILSGVLVAVPGAFRKYLDTRERNSFQCH